MADEKQDNNEIANTNSDKNKEAKSRTSSMEGNVLPPIYQAMQEVGGFIAQRSHATRMSDETIQALAAKAMEMNKEDHITKRRGLTILAALIGFLAFLVTTVIIACIVVGQTDFLKDVFGSIALFIGGGGSIILFQKVYQQSTSSSTKEED